MPNSAPRVRKFSDMESPQSYSIVKSLRVRYYSISTGTALVFIWSNQLPNVFCLFWYQIKNFIWPDLFWPGQPITKCHLVWFGTKWQHFIWSALVWPGQSITKCDLFWFGTKLDNFIWPHLFWSGHLITK